MCARIATATSTAMSCNGSVARCRSGRIITGGCAEMAIRVRPRSKYGAQPTEVDGIRFASKKEAHRYAELKLLEKAGEIRDLELQPRFPLEVQGAVIAEYRGDFRYQERSYEGTCRGCWRTRVEDVKGVRTPVYR